MINSCASSESESASTMTAEIKAYIEHLPEDMLAYIFMSGAHRDSIVTETKPNKI